MIRRLPTAALRALYSLLDRYASRACRGLLVDVMWELMCRDLSSAPGGDC